MNKPLCSVSICVATYKRPRGLARLLGALDELRFDPVQQPAVEIVVVDNDSSASGRHVVERYRVEGRWSIRYTVETRRGIAFARNTAIEYAGPTANFVAFIDDDEVPSPTWLSHLLAAQHIHEADIVAGPVLARFEIDVPAWINKGGFFDRPSYPSGTSLKHAGAGNLLIRTTVFFSGNIRFNERMGLTGGEDTHFSMRAIQQGYKLIWSDDATVDEWNPATRLTIKWLLTRSYRGGTTFSACMLDLDPTFSTRLRRLILAASRAAVAALRFVPAALGGKAHAVRAMQNVMAGLGGVAGALGWRYEEYRTTHGA